MRVKNMRELGRNESLSIRKIERLYYLVTNQGVYEANEIGATIVNAVGRDLSIDDMCLRISQKYSHNNLEEIKNDIEKYIEFLLTEGILVSTNG